MECMVGGGGSVLQTLLLKGSPEASASSPINYLPRSDCISASRAGQPVGGSGVLCLHNIVRFQLSSAGEQQQ